MKSWIAGCLFFISFTAFALERKSLDETIRMLSNEQAPLKYDAKEIPACVLQGLRRWTQTRFVIVNWNQSFPPAKDISHTGDGQFRMLFFAKLSSEMTLLCFQNNTGVGAAYHCLLFSEQKNRCEVKHQFAFAGPVWSLRDLRAAIIDNASASQSDGDYLVPVKEALGSSATYQELWQRKLLLTPGEIARFVGLPGTVGLETAISVYRAPGKEDSLPGNYWVTATQASERLWNAVVPGAEGRVDPNTILVERCDAPIGETTALALHKVWLTILSQSRPQRKVNAIVVDSSREIFAATSGGKVLQAESSTAPKENTKALVNLASSLLEYCGAEAPKRPVIATDIERAAAALMDRVALRSTSKRRNSKSTSSSKTGITPRKQGLSQSTAGPKLAKRVARLGSSIDDFRARWGPPVRGVVLARTTRLVWKPTGRKNKLPADICEAQVSFLDRIACEIVLRSRKPLTRRKSVKLAKMVVPRFRASDLARHKSRSDGGRTYALSSGGYITFWTYRKQAVIVTRSPLFLQNNQVFAQEAASVRPPTVSRKPLTVVNRERSAGMMTR